MNSQRIISIDALRGIAVILMIMQHLSAWLWSEPLRSINLLYDKSALLYWFNMLGFLSAPLFILLAGFGAFFLSRKSSSKVIVKRGMLIMLTGLFLNLITPHWFSPFSWYVLHLIGFALILFPLLRRLSTLSLLFTSALLFVLAPLLQTGINSPLLLSREMMSRVDSISDPFRIIFVEGHFPLFPWLGLFLLGIVTARWYSEGRTKMIFVAGVMLSAVGLMLFLCFRLGLPFATYGTWYRFFIFQISIFPVQPPLFLIVYGMVIVFLYAGLSSDLFNRLKILSWFGRVSLTIFVLHIFVAEELTRVIGIYKFFDASSTVLIIGGFIALLALLLFLWKRVDFKYGFEYCIKRVAG